MWSLLGPASKWYWWKPTPVWTRSIPAWSLCCWARVCVLWFLISSAAAEALREGSEGNVPKRGPHDAASFFGRHCSGRRSHKKHVSSGAVACQHSSLSPRPERLCSLAKNTNSTEGEGWTEIIYLQDTAWLPACPTLKWHYFVIVSWSGWG